MLKSEWNKELISDSEKHLTHWRIHETDTSHQFASRVGNNGRKHFWASELLSKLIWLHQNFHLDWIVGEQNDYQWNIIRTYTSRKNHLDILSDDDNETS
jgi:hypothetical protein